MILVSIVLSVYNGEKFIEQAIKSVENQTYADWELIIIDDGSNDRTEAIIKDYLKTDDRIKYYKKTNSGLTKSLNYGLEKVNSKYIARLDADDIWVENKLEKQIQFLEKNDDIYICGCAFSEIDENGNYICPQRTIFLKDNTDIQNNLCKCNPFFHSSVVFRSIILKQIGMYNEDFKYAQDYEYWVRILSKYKGANIPDVLAYRRYSDNMISAKKEKEQRQYAIKAKYKAIKQKKLNVVYYKYIVNDLMIVILPKFIIKLIRKVKMEIKL